MSANSPAELFAWPPGRNEPCWCGSGRKYRSAAPPCARCLGVSSVPSEQVVDVALAALEAVDHDAAQAARAAYGSLTFGEGLQAITGHGVADFLWYQLPTKWLCDLDEKLFLAAALGELFTRLGMPRYAAMCTADTTAEIITAYERRGRAAGLTEYRAALAASGLQSPDLPGVLVWGSVMGAEEASAYWSVSAALESAISAGHLRPGTAGWRRTAAQVTAAFLDGVHDETTGSTWLQWVHTERLQRFADSRGPARARLAGPRRPVRQPVPVRRRRAGPRPGAVDARPRRRRRCATATGNLTRPLVAEGCRRFDWLTTTGNPRSESDIVELWTLRDWAKQMGVVRRSGRRLLLSTVGKTVQTGGTAALWQATMDGLLGPGDADAAAGEIALMLMLTGHDLDYRDLNAAVADALAGEGWHGQASGQPSAATKRPACWATCVGGYACSA
jgi:hypothetical protein